MFKKREGKRTAGLRLVIRCLPAFVALAWGATAGAGAEPVVAVLGTDATETPLANLQVHVDDAGSLTLADFRGAAVSFDAHDGPIHSFGLLNKPVWLRFEVENGSDTENWVLDLSNPRLGRVKFWAVDDTGAVVDEAVMGLQESPETRAFWYPAPAFPFEIPHGAQRTIYLRIDHQGTLVFKTALYPHEAFKDHVFGLWLNNFLFEGALLALTGFMLLICVGLRERSYLWHALLAVSFLLFAVSASGTANMVLWPRAAWWADHAPTVFGMIMAAASVPSSVVFFGAREHSPRLYAVACGLAAFALITAVLGLTPWTGKYILRGFITFAVPLVLFLLSFQAIRRGHAPAYYYSFGWVVSALAATGAILRDTGMVLLPGFSHLELTWIFFIGFMAWGMALTSRIRERQEENRAALEAAVDKRTHQLTEALAEVKTLSGLLPICSNCKKIRDDQGFWREVEAYVSHHTDADFSHGVCPECTEELYPGYYAKRRKESGN
jgi:hypothetical protein